MVSREKQKTQRQVFLLFLLDNVLQPRNHLVLRQRAESEPGAPRLQGWDDLGQVVADEAKSSVFCELLND